MSNKSNGNKFEQQFCKYLSSLGYYVIYIEGGRYSNSQPCDIVTIKNNIPMLIDCKILENKTGRFPIDRIEENQRNANKKYKKCGNKLYYLVILWEDNIYYIDLKDIDFNLKSINLKDFNPKKKGWCDYVNSNR